MIVNHHSESGKVMQLVGRTIFLPTNLWHDLSFSQVGMNIEILGNAIYQGKDTYEIGTDNLIEIPTMDMDIEYEIWKTSKGISVVYRERGGVFGDIEEPLVLLGWFTVPMDSTTLDDVEINVILIDKIDGGSEVV